MLALVVGAVLLQPQDVPPPPPIGDYFPGPWLVFIDRSGRIGSDGADIVRRVRDMATILPTPLLDLCPEGATLGRRGDRRSLRAAFAKGYIAPHRIAAGPPA